MFKLAQKYARRQPEEWGPLFHRILQNQIRDWYRRTRVRKYWMAWVKMGNDDAGEDPIQTAADPRTLGPEDDINQQRAVAVLTAALEQLPVRQQQVFLLRIHDGLDVAETAKAMACSPGSVKTHLSRALSKLRQELGSYYFDDE